MENCIEIYRIEHLSIKNPRTGLFVGPYYNGDTHSSYFEIHGTPDYDRHPAPEDIDTLTIKLMEKNFSRLSDFCFGFSTVSQLEDWFNHDELNTLRDKSFKLSVYSVDCDDIIETDKQVLFKPDSASIIHRIDL